MGFREYRIGGNRGPYLRQDRQPHYAPAALDSANTVATTSTRAPAGNAQLTRTRTRHSAHIAAAGAAMPSTMLPTCATSLSGAAYGQAGGQYMIAEPLISSVHPSPRIAALATPPPLPCAPAASETLHQAWMRLISSSVAPTAGETRPCNGNSPTPKSRRMCSVPTAIAARLSQSHGGSRHDWPDHARSLLSMIPSSAGELGGVELEGLVVRRPAVDQEDRGPLAPVGVVDGQRVLGDDVRHPSSSPLKLPLPSAPPTMTASNVFSKREGSRGRPLPLSTEWPGAELLGNPGSGVGNSPKPSCASTFVRWLVATLALPAFSGYVRVVSMPH